MSPAQVPLHREWEFLARGSFTQKPEVKGFRTSYIQKLFVGIPAPGCSGPCCWKSGLPRSRACWCEEGEVTLQAHEQLITQACCWFLLLVPAAAAVFCFCTGFFSLTGKNSRRPQVCLLPDLQPLRSEVTPNRVW